MLSFFRKLFGQNDPAGDTVSQEMAHINQEVYKKSVELTERNKTLLLLRKIDEMILSAVTNQNVIAQQVTSLIVKEEDFNLVSLFIYDKNEKLLKRLARSVKGANDTQKTLVNDISISTYETDNIMVQAVNERKVEVVDSPVNVLLEPVDEQVIIKCLYVFPLIARNELIGAMVFALSKEEFNVSDYTKDLLYRLAQVIGIAMDNAMLYNELQDANEKLKELDKLKDEFVSLASHELRTPMTAIKSYLWMTLQEDAGKLNETQKLYLERSYNSVERLIKLVNDMLNISRIESGRVTVELQKADLYKLTEEVVEDVQPRAAELGVHIAVSPVTDLPNVLADPDKIKEVLFNLLGNSLKFTPKGGSITVSFNQNADMIETTVTDTGTGISSENISKLFQKFSMLAESYSVNKNATGTGLGLYISRSIIDLHQGKIWAASEGVGKGSRFSFSLKIFKADDLSLINTNSTMQPKEKLGLVHSQI